MRLTNSRRANIGGVAAWSLIVVVLVVSLIAARSMDGQYGSMGWVFALSTPAAALCLVSAAAMLWVAWRDGNGELGILGLFFFTTSELALVHSLTIPGVLYDANPTTDFAGFLALPGAVVVGWPLLAPRSPVAAALGRRWRAWTATWLVTVSAVSAIWLLNPSLSPTFDVLSPAPSLVLMAAGAAICWMSWRHLRLYRLSGLTSSFAAAVGLILLGSSSLGWLQATPLGVAFWLAHVLDVSGVALATIMAAVFYRQADGFRTTMRPIVTLDPLVSLELAMDPTVHDFVEMLEKKDRITRDHVVRVGELATRIGLRGGVPARGLATLAVAAVLHDIGKLEIDAAIINKPGRLEPAEYAAMQTHAAIGADILSRSPALAPAAPLVRSHHERPDGRGYPDGIGGDTIPIEVRIISACDAFDAIAHTRQYRDGKGAAFALAVLREHAGTQFDPQVVEWLAAEIDHGGIDAVVFHEIGRTAVADDLASVCPDCDLALTPGSAQ